jgi:hypothetical protein
MVKRYRTLTRKRTETPAQFASRAGWIARSTGGMSVETPCGDLCPTCMEFTAQEEDVRTLYLSTSGHCDNCAVERQCRCGCNG